MDKKSRKSQRNTVRVSLERVFGLLLACLVLFSSLVFGGLKGAGADFEDCSYGHALTANDETSSGTNNGANNGDPNDPNDNDPFTVTLADLLGLGYVFCEELSYGARVAVRRFADTQDNNNNDNSTDTAMPMVIIGAQNLAGSLALYRLAQMFSPLDVYPSGKPLLPLQGFDLVFALFSLTNGQTYISEHASSLARAVDANRVLLYINLDGNFEGSGLTMYADEVRRGHADFFVNVANEQAIELTRIRGGYRPILINHEYSRFRYMPFSLFGNHAPFFAQGINVLNFNFSMDAGAGLFQIIQEGLTSDYFIQQMIASRARANTFSVLHHPAMYITLHAVIFLGILVGVFFLYKKLTKDSTAALAKEKEDAEFEEARKANPDIVFEEFGI